MALIVRIHLYITSIHLRRSSIIACSCIGRGRLPKGTIFWRTKSKLQFRFLVQAKKKYMCVYGHPTDPIFQPPTLTFFIGNYSTLIFASDPINFYTEFGYPFLLFNQQQRFIYSTASFLSKLRAKKVEKLCNSS
jgi:hypothetical protein